jgi:hypothetical protein
MKNFLLRLFFIFLFVTSAIAQQGVGDKAKTAVNQPSTQAQAKERRGTIKGRVINDSGQPLANAGVNLYLIGVAQGQRRNLGTDENGRFEAEDLSPAAYSILPYAPGYVTAMNPNEWKYYRIGDEVTLTMMKGGVITGLVRNAAGEPVVGLMVSALRVRDAEGKPSTRGASFPRDRMTDDRGIYRIYGIEPGAYLIVAGGRSSYMDGINKYAEDVKTYHPSSTRETAAEVMVQNGQEVSGIDINYRGEKGRIVSGTIAGVNSELSNASLDVSLVHAASGLFETRASTPVREGKNGFAIYGVPDGEYLIRAELFAGASGKNRLSSQARRVTVKGNDVSGIELGLAPMASISGIVVLEQAPVADSKLKCEKRRVATLEETLITFRKDTKGESLEQKWLNAGSVLAPSPKGEFDIYRLFAGSYRMSVNLPSETWYLKSQSLHAAAKRNQPNHRNQQPNDLAAKGVVVKAGEQVATLIVTIAEGAASFSGTVKAVSERQALPPRLRVYLIPGERENANDVLRFFHSEVGFDGAFSFANLAPGKYFLLSRVGDEEELSDNTSRPIYWDTEGRALLRKEAEAINSLIELQPCGKVTDFSWRHGLPPQTVTPALKK